MRVTAALAIMALLITTGCGGGDSAEPASGESGMPEVKIEGGDSQPVAPAPTGETPAAADPAPDPAPDPGGQAANPFGDDPKPPPTDGSEAGPEKLTPVGVLGRALLKGVTSGLPGF